MADIHPIRDKADNERALAEIDAIIKQNPDGNTPDAERLELLSLLVYDYESKHNPIQPPDDAVEVILFYTVDKDFGEKIFREKRPDHGIILLRSKDESSKNKIAAMERLLANFATRLSSQFVVVTDTQVRFSSSEE